MKGARLVYQAGVLAAATVSFVNTKTGVSTSTRVRRIAEAPAGALAIDWDRATELETTLEDLDRKPRAEATFAPLPLVMQQTSSYRRWGGAFADWAFRTQTMEAFKSAIHKQTSEPGETEEDFRRRLGDMADPKQQQAIERIQKRYAGQKRSLEEKINKAEQTRDREAQQARGRKTQTAISLGSTILSVFFGRKILSTGTLGRATTTMRDVSRSMSESGDVERADQSLEAAKQKIEELDAQLQAEIDALKEKMDPNAEELQKVLVRPRKSDVNVDALGLVWMPVWSHESGKEG